jgi:haloalkane dehalogenase
LKNIILVLHDWGSGLGFHYANLNQGNIKAITFMEAMYAYPTRHDMPMNVRVASRVMRTPLIGPFLVKRANIFMTKMLPDLINRELTEEETAYYGTPYPNAKSRKPLLQWIRSVPFDGGKPYHVAEAHKAWTDYIMNSDIPKLFFYVSPGVIIKEKDVTIIEDKMKNLKSIDLGEGLHFIQEDYPHEIGEGIAKWHDELNL